MHPITDVVQSVWNEIHVRLQSRKDLINKEIGRYPVPIAGCDQQFNHLLEQRRRILEEMHRLRQSESASLAADDPTRPVLDFLQTSRCIGVDTKEQLTALILNKLAMLSTI